MVQIRWGSCSIFRFDLHSDRYGGRSRHRNSRRTFEIKHLYGRYLGRYQTGIPGSILYRQIRRSAQLWLQRSQPGQHAFQSRASHNDRSVRSGRFQDRTLQHRSSRTVPHGHHGNSLGRPLARLGRRSYTDSLDLRLPHRRHPGRTLGIDTGHIQGFLEYQRGNHLYHDELDSSQSGNLVVRFA